MRRTWTIVLFMVIWTPLTVLAVTWGFMFDWPDFVHVDYGFPLVWATHTLSTIAGPADTWNVDLPALFTDLLFWMGSMVIAVAIMLYILSPEQPRGAGKSASS